MNRISEKEYSECLFRQKVITNPKVTNLIQSLEIHLIETNIILKAIDSFSNKKLVLFDSIVGDRKCQTRASMILDLAQDLAQNDTSLQDELKNETPIIKQTIFQTNSLLNKLKTLKHLELKQLSLELQELTLNEYLIQHKLIYHPTFNIKLISLCYFTTLTLDQMLTETNNLLSSNKLNKLLISAKKELCKLSIDYEQTLAQKYDSTDNALCLEQIEEKGICTMTSFYNSFRAILKKMKQRDQSFIKKIILFCACGGIQKKITKFFKNHKNSFIEQPISERSHQAAMIFEGYQFPGSLTQLKQILNVPMDEAYVPKQYHKPCLCDIPSEPQKIGNTEEAIMAFFAQHPQFTNDAEIKFDSLEPMVLNLYQEYEYFKSLPGFSEKDMSYLYLDHIYPSTINDVLEQDDISSSNIAMPIIQPQAYVTDHAHAHCSC